MKTVIAMLAYIMLSQAQAQQPVQQEVYSAQPVQAQSMPAPQQAAQKKRTVLYDERTNELVEVQPQVLESAPQASSSTGAPIYILNNQKYQGYQGTTQGQTQAQVQEQPTTLIQDTPLRTSPADNMRMKRKETEDGTEDVIVQQLERARMEDELRRRDRFNSAIAPQAPAANLIAPAAIQQQQVVIPQAVAVPQEEIEFIEERPTSARPQKTAEEKVDIRSEIRAALDEKKVDDSSAVKSTYYISGLVGMGKYPDVINVRGNVATGVSVGTVTPERVVAEGTFIYGTYELEDLFRSTSMGFPRIVDMRQYNLAAALKYQLLPGKLRPSVGGLASYTRRSYSERTYDFLTTDSFDVGLVAGLDLQLTDALAIGFDFRYLTNISSRDNSGTSTSFSYQRSSGNEVESLDYYTSTVTGKFSF